MQTRQEIAETLREWEQQGKINSKAKWDCGDVKVKNAEINRLLARGVICHTSIHTIVATPDIVNDFEELLKSGRVMPTNIVCVRYSLKTTYEINTYCDGGGLLKFSDFGKSAVLFID